MGLKIIKKKKVVIYSGLFIITIIDGVMKTSYSY